MRQTVSFPSVRAILAASPKQPASLRLREELIRKIADIIQEKDLSVAEVSEQCGITQARVNDLLRRRASRFSLDALVNIASELGQRVDLKFDASSLSSPSI